MKRALLIIAVVLPFAALGIWISRRFPTEFILYNIAGLIFLETVIRLTSKRLGGIQHWTIEAIWLPYHSFLAYLIGGQLNFSQPTLLVISIMFPLLVFCAVAASTKLPK